MGFNRRSYIITLPTFGGSDGGGFPQLNSRDLIEPIGSDT